MSVENQLAFLSSFRQSFVMNEHSFFLSSLNMSESENFSDFKTSNEFMLSSYEKIEVDVCKTLSSATSVQNSLIIVNRV